MTESTPTTPSSPPAHRSATDSHKPEREELLERLLAEMLQTETSAAEHARKEAERIGEGEPPALALLAAATHAERALPQLRALRGGSASVGEAIGHVFSALRDAASDRVMRDEKSYRATLLGLHHGVGCGVMTRAVAGTLRRTDIASFCDRWLDERRPLVDDCERQIPWFASHSEGVRERA
jgi:hypothetical protein